MAITMLWYVTCDLCLMEGQFLYSQAEAEAYLAQHRRHDHPDAVPDEQETESYPYEEEEN